MRDCTNGQGGWIPSLPENIISETSTVFRALGNPLRLRMVLLMLEHVELDVRTLQREIEVLTQSAISQHLGVLRQAGIVKTRSNGTFRHYSVQDERIIRLLELFKLNHLGQAYLEDIFAES